MATTLQPSGYGNPEPKTSVDAERIALYQRCIVAHRLSVSSTHEIDRVMWSHVLDELLGHMVHIPDRVMSRHLELRLLRRQSKR